MAVAVVQSWVMVMEKMERLVELSNCGFCELWNRRQREVSRICSPRPLTLNSVNKNLEGAGLGGDHSSVEYEGPMEHPKIEYRISNWLYESRRHRAGDLSNKWHGRHV